MAIPDFQSCMRPLLQAVADGEVHQFNAVIDRVCQYFELTDAELNERLPSGKQTYMRNRLGWARTYMKKAGLVIAPGRGQIQITERGQQALSAQPERVDVRYLKQFPEFVDFHTAKPKVDDGRSRITTEDEAASADPQERLEAAHSEIHDSLASELLETIKEQSPQFLEQLVVELLQKMGYGGWSADSGAATQYSADGGIDGVIDEDPLGLDTIYLQAKRYTENSVSRPDIQAFVGALEMKRARKGVFITTSRFSREAIEYCRLIQKKVVLIDGPKLAELMVKHNLGVSVRQTYEVKTIDSDYFSD